MLGGFVRALSYLVSLFKILAIWSVFRWKSIMFKITADQYSQSKHYYVMTLMILKPVMIVFCSLGIKWWTVTFSVCLRLKWFLSNPTTVFCSWSQQREHKLVKKMLFSWFWRMTLMVLCAGSKQDRMVLVYTYEILMAKTKAKSPNIKYWLVMYPKIPCASISLSLCKC